MTHIEQFKEMLVNSQNKLAMPDNDYGENVSVVFEIEAGIGGSDTTLAEAFFNKKTGQFVGIHHCD